MFPQVQNLVQSYVSLRLPLFVSYVYHSPVGKGWQHYDLQTQLRMSFVYDTGIMWDQGIGTPPDADLRGLLYLTSMRIRDDGRLVVSFRTEAKFRGLFVTNHQESDSVAIVISPSHPELALTLILVKKAETYNNPKQEWSFVSNYAVKDYSGMYTVKLVPCTTSTDITYSSNAVCNPRDLLSFDINIRFQQVS